MTTKLTPEQKAEFQRIIDNMPAPVPVLITLEMGAKLLVDPRMFCATGAAPG